MTSSLLRPTVLRHARTSGIRWRSSIHAYQSGRFSLIVQPSTPKKTVLDFITANSCGSVVKTRHGVSTKMSNAAVILASLDFAPWLEDTNFMSSLLEGCLFDLEDDESAAREVTVLSAVVDGLCPSQPHGNMATGLSILHGQVNSLLPGLWDNHLGSPKAASDTQSSISVALSPLLCDFRPLNVTVPLANTVFQNGRRSTLLAGRWLSDGKQPYQLSQIVEKQAQAIIPSLKSIQTYTNVAIPLFALTTPRKIVAGLGNIIRQVEVDEQPSPASKELESAIPALLQSRSASSLDVTPGPIGVWALVIPQHVMNNELFEELLAAKDAILHSEQNAAEKMSRNFSRLLAAGCHLHRILSGGGGWGSKQGLLSLDPQSRYSVSEEQDVESFISSFKGKESSESIVTPGAYIQFLVEPTISKGERSSLQVEPRSKSLGKPSMIFGTDAGGMNHTTNGLGNPVTVIENHFGAISTQGIFIESVPEPDTDLNGIGSTHTKLAAPQSYIWEGSKRWV